MNFQFENSEACALELDRQDPLRSFRQQFMIPRRDGREQIYFLGNSLGLQPRHTQAALQNILDQWANYGVEAFFRGNDPWMDYHQHLAIPMGEIVGALPPEITVMNQLTVNLHLMLISFYRPSGNRKKILCEAKAFPSDQYMFETHIRHYGFNPDEIVIELAPREGEATLRKEDILSAIEAHANELALVLLGGINYYTGQVLDMASITEAGHRAGAMVGFDLAHAAGNISLSLHDWQVDFACWCTYKYLNSGPGAVGGVYIHERHHQDDSLPRFAGWWGYDKATRFRMEKGFIPISNAEGWQLSTPSLLLYAAHRSALEVFSAAGWSRLLEKQKQLTAWLWFVLDGVNNTLAVDRKMSILTPREETERGCQVSLYFPRNGKDVFNFLEEKGVMADWREPNVIRVAPVPSYNTYHEVWLLGRYLSEMLER